jgi:DNA-binding MarR family transcriptional regulator
MEVRRLNRLSRQLREIALRASQNNGEVPLSAGELLIVEHVARHPASTITDIARETGLAQSRVSTVVRHLSDERVFVCSKDDKDRRQTRVALSPEAAVQAFEESGSRPIDSALVTVVPHLSDDEALRVSTLLDELGTLMEPPARSGSDT